MNPRIILGMGAIGALNLLGLVLRPADPGGTAKATPSDEKVIQRVLASMSDRATQAECGSTCEKACRKKCVFG